jgi:hypothetical protein
MVKTLAATNNKFKQFSYRVSVSTMEAIAAYYFIQYDGVQTHSCFAL